MFDSLKKWIDSLSDEFKSRFNDAFIGYLITFEIIFNWKFFYTLIISNHTTSESVISRATTYLSLPSFFNCFLEFFQPSHFTLAVMCSFLMTVVYPFLSLGIQLLRRVSLYYYHSILLKDYPSREAYSKLVISNKENLEKIKELKSTRVNELYSLSYTLQDLFPTSPKREHLQVGTPGNKQVFIVDEVVTTSPNNRCVIEKITLGRTSRDEQYIIYKKVSDEVYLMYKLSSYLLISEEFKASGQSYLYIDGNGLPEYINLTKRNQLLESSSRYTIVSSERTSQSKTLSFSRSPY